MDLLFKITNRVYPATNIKSTQKCTPCTSSVLRVHQVYAEVYSVYIKCTQKCTQCTSQKTVSKQRRFSNINKQQSKNLKNLVLPLTFHFKVYSYSFGLEEGGR